jgi:hypothetical protein
MKSPGVHKVSIELHQSVILGKTPFISVKVVSFFDSMAYLTKGCLATDCENGLGRLCYAQSQKVASA